MKNEKINEIKKNRAINNNKPFWMKRTGKCDPKICGGACCRYTVRVQNKAQEYHSLTFESGNIVKSLKYDDQALLIIENFNCPNLAINARCKLHGKKKQPYTCDVFPMHPEDGVYRAVKKYCSYKFVKVKNGKYKRTRKKKGTVQEMR